jgi:Lrp/AsnC family transcriptional regulator, regulator of ectoine-degradation genes
MALAMLVSRRSEAAGDQPWDSSMAAGRSEEMPHDKLDAYDIRILALLQKNGRIKKVNLASQVGLSLSSCWERLHNLEEAGYIREYRAEINLARLVKTELIIATMTLERHTRRDFARFEEAIEAITEVVACYAVGGGIDYVLHIVAHDIEHYQQLIDRMLEMEIGIAVYFTYVVTKTVKRFEGVPIAGAS